jgi:hypothetical protein
VVWICRNRGAFSWRLIISTQGLGIRCAVEKSSPGKLSVWLEPAINFRAGRRCGRKSGQNRGPRGQVFVRGVETRRSPKAVAGPQSRMTTKYGPISTPATKICPRGPRICAATRRAGANSPHFVVARRSKILHIRRSSLLELRKIGSQRRPWES